MIRDFLSRDFSFYINEGREFFKRGFSLKSIILIPDDEVRNAMFMGFFEAMDEFKRDLNEEAAEQEEFFNLPFA